MAERLQRYLARAGVASRRHAEELITAGRVTVNNQPTTTLGTKVEPNDLVALDGKLVMPPEEVSWYVLYKPAGVVTTLDDPQGRPTVRGLLGGIPTRVFPLGRLDWDAEGALLLTDDGAAAHRLLHPSFQVPRTYLAKVKGNPTDESLARLVSGVRLEDGPARALEAERFQLVERNTWLKVTVGEGRPHLVKRLCAAIGHPVVRLFRPHQAGISVAGLQPGEFRALRPEEMALLTAVAAGQPVPAMTLKLPARRHGRTDDDGDSTDEAERGPRAPKPPRFGTRAWRSTPRRAAGRAMPPTERPARGARPPRAGFVPGRPRDGARGGRPGQSRAEDTSRRDFQRGRSNFRGPPRDASAPRGEGRKHTGPEGNSAGRQRFQSGRPGARPSGREEASQAGRFGRRAGGGASFRGKPSGGRGGFPSRPPGARPGLGGEERSPRGGGFAARAESPRSGRAYPAGTHAGWKPRPPGAAGPSGEHFRPRPPGGTGFRGKPGDARGGWKGRSPDAAGSGRRTGPAGRGAPARSDGRGAGRASGAKPGGGRWAGKPQTPRGSGPRPADGRSGHRGPSAGHRGPPRPRGGGPRGPRR